MGACATLRLERKLAAGKARRYSLAMKYATPATTAAATAKQMITTIGSLGGGGGMSVIGAPSEILHSWLALPTARGGKS